MRSANPGSPLGPMIGVGRTAEIYAWGDGEILKLFRKDWPADMIAMEVRVCRAVNAASLASPRVGEVVQIDGRNGLIFERIDGPTMLQALAARPWSVSRLAQQFAELHAAMHQQTCPGLETLRGRLNWDIRQAPHLSDNARAQLLERLAKMPEGDALLHYDFHPGNVLLSSRGPLIIDWMSAICGPAEADIARTILLFRMAKVPPGTPAMERVSVKLLRRMFLRAYQARYAHIRPVDWNIVESWVPFLAAARLCENIPAEEDGLLRIAEAM